MPVQPWISLCIPTCNRIAHLRATLESGLRELAEEPSGMVEILVCDNGSSDGTWDFLSRAKAEHPELQIFRNDSKVGFDRNYIRCVREARGEFVWVMEDGDVWQPGSLRKIRKEIEDGADACLCLAEACDQDLNPVAIHSWYLEENPKRIWRLQGREDLIRYFNCCARTAGAFAFISVSVFRRDRFLHHWESVNQEKVSGFHHVLGMMSCFRKPMNLHVIPEVLVRNRLGDTHTDPRAPNNPFGRWMDDLVHWAEIADAVFGEDRELHDSFSRIVGRNHHDTILLGLRQHAPDEEAWQNAKPYLIRAGFTPMRIEAVDFSFQHMYGGRLPMASLNPDALCIADLAIVARGANRVAVVALGLQDLAEGAAILAALRDRGRLRQLRVFCSPECAELLNGFSLQCLDPKRYMKDVPYRESIAQAMAEVAPELVVNLDRYRNIVADDLVAAALPAGAVAYELPLRSENAAQLKAAHGLYARLIPRAAGADAMFETLGLKGHAPALWPSPAAQEQARGFFKEIGWDPAGTLIVMVDHPSIPEDPIFQSALAEAAGGDWTVVGMGIRGTRQILDVLLAPWGDRAVNLAGNLGISAMAALLQLCAGHVGGSPLFLSMAKACGCAHAPLAAAGRTLDAAEGEG